MITLEQLKQMALDAGYSMQPGPYTYKDDPKLRAFIFFDKHLVCNWTTIKCNIAQGARSCLDPDLKFIYGIPKADGYFNIKIKVHPGVYYGQTETATLSGNIPFYDFVDGEEVEVSSLEIKYLPNQEYNIHCYPEKDKSIQFTLETPTLKQEVNVPWGEDQLDGGDVYPPEPGDVARVGSAIVGSSTAA